MPGLDLSTLNPPQREAVSTQHGPLLVLAGAGTGKTRVITFRIAELIRRGVSPERILSVTFTNKAAKEMLERATQLLGNKGARKKPVISTFHSLCVKILRDEIEVLGYPSRFAIYDRGDQESAARTALRDVRVADNAMRPADLLNVISKWKMAGIPPDRAADFVENDQEFLAAVAYRKYQKNLRSSGAVDFDDLLLLTDQLFKHHPEVLQRQQQKFDYVQVDEYQDTNGVQFRLVEALVAPHKNICVVGDDDQSIYGWRGAEVEHILGFDRHFPGAKVVRLENNYRCTDKILDLANRLVKHNKGRHDKTLIAHKSSEHPVRFAEFESEVEEAEKLVDEIKWLIEEKNFPSSSIAILFRTNEQPRVFETELRRRDIPYVLVGSQSFFDKKEVRDLMAYLKAIAFPQDDISLMRIINTPSRGIGATTVEKVSTRAVQQGCPFFVAVDEAFKAGEISQKAADAIKQFEQLLDSFRKRSLSSPRQLADLVHELIQKIDYDAEIARQYKDEAQQVARKEVLEGFVSSVSDYVQQAETPSLYEFIETTALGGREEESNKEDQLAGQGVKLMTLHSAKGLEFPWVYLVGLEEGYLPHRRSVEDASRKAIEEERRLAYVGITRAKDYLTISRAGTRKKWGKTRLSLPSRFLHEMKGEAAPPDVAAAIAQAEDAAAVGE
ncbi:MAG: UvrD-helicase domain-containing protein [Planctomycetaceae bacterium]|nr:UvrD-helicase domain-containing protein [Planctomycetaceae bacterium]